MMCYVYFTGKRNQSAKSICMIHFQYHSKVMFFLPASKAPTIKPTTPTTSSPTTKPTTPRTEPPTPPMTQPTTPVTSNLIVAF